MAKNIITTIEITDTHIKLLQARVQQGLLITAGNIAKIEAATDEHVAERLAQMISGRVGELIGIIPRRFAILKHIKLPSHSAAEIKRMVALQISNHVPYSREDIVFDIQILEKDTDGYSKVLLLVVHKDVILRYLKIFEKARLHPHRLVLSSFGIAEWSAYQLKKMKEDPGPFALVNIDDTSSEICFCHHKKMLFARSIHFGAKDLNPEHLADFLEQIGLTLGNYKKDNMGPDIKKIFVITNLKEAGVLVDKLKEYYQLPIELRNVFDNLPCHKDFNLSALWGQSGLSLASSVGFLLGDIKKQINLMPLNIQANKKTQLQKKAWLKMATMIAMALLLGGVAANTKVYKDMVYLKKVEEKNKETQREAERAKIKIDTIEFLRNKLRHPIYIVDIMKELYKLCPPEISFNALYLDAQGTLTIQGLAMAGSSVNTFQGNLVNSPLFKAVNLEFATKRKRLQDEYTDFKITCKLSPTPEIKNE